MGQDVVGADRPRSAEWRKSIGNPLNRVLVDGQVIEQDTKSAKPRKISIDTETVAVLKRWKTAQTAERLAWAGAWTDSGRLFTGEDGTALHPDAISTAFEKAEASVKVPTIRLHDLRHTSGTLAWRPECRPRWCRSVSATLTSARRFGCTRTCSRRQQADAAARIGAAIYGRRAV